MGGWNSLEKKPKTDPKTDYMWRTEKKKPYGQGNRKREPCDPTPIIPFNCTTNNRAARGLGGCSHEVEGLTNTRKTN